MKNTPASSRPLYYGESFQPAGAPDFSNGPGLTWRRFMHTETDGSHDVCLPKWLNPPRQASRGRRQSPTVTAARAATPRVLCMCAPQETAHKSTESPAFRKMLVGLSGMPPRLCRVKPCRLFVPEREEMRNTTTRRLPAPRHQRATSPSSTRRRRRRADELTRDLRALCESSGKGLCRWAAAAE